MTILLQVRCRPHPVIDLGAVDCSVSLVLCDLEQPDAPIVYASDSFLELTGYSRQEVIGRNCRFLQTPNSAACTATAGIDRVAIKRMSQAVQSKQEIQLQVYNYKKNGQRFTNILSIIPLQMGLSHHNYAVGFQCEL
jgi:PAS domain S-box-containing protein